MQNEHHGSAESKLMWCIACNIPYPESDLTKVEVCPKCNSVLRKIIVNRWKEMVLAFEFDRRRIKDTIDEQYGSRIGKSVNDLFDRNDVVILNHVRRPGIYACSDDEYLEDAFEVIAEGKVICVLSYSFIKEWSVILNPYVFDIPENYRRTALDLADRLRKSVGMNSPFDPSDGEIKVSRYPSLNETIDANAFIIEALRDNSINMAKEVIRKYGSRNIFSGFSGGKDSQLTVLLLLEAGIRPVLFFSDIEVELPGIRDFVISFAKRKGLEVIVRKPPGFFENLDKEGPPTRGNRWCTDLMKVDHFHNYVMENLPNERIVNFLGIRAEESDERRRDGYEVIYGNEITSRPIFHWGCLHLWFYLIKSEEPYLDWYEKGIYRTGCWLCPFASTTQLDYIKNSRPKDWERYQRFLDEYGRKNHFSKPWYDHHLWRFGYFIPKELRKITGFKEPPIFKMKKWLIFLKAEIGRRLGRDR
ncbi:MAG: phosphoadenosine phosphosulfate reductase family protein [Candidatus Thermoplasmatota archaeon]|nr:phosphoadenosine phosphosulfate reductase family protein [Candidatus Thermoplasmatota archaeon]